MLVDVPKLVESPLHELVAAAEIALTVENHDWRTFVLIEIAFEVALNCFQVVIPLSREELKECALYFARLLKSLDTSETFMVTHIGDNSCQC